MSGNPMAQVPEFLDTRKVARRLLARVWRCWAPPPRMTTREWADQFMYLSADSGAARHGKYRSQVTPWLREIQEAVDDPRIKKLVVMKSAQIGWTAGVVMPYILRRIDLDPSPIVVMFPTMEAAKEFNVEKFIPTVDVTPRLHGKIDVSTTRRSGNRWSFKKFAGGFLKFVGSNSPRSVKSSSAPVLIVEEPDDASRDLKGQGDSIRLLEDRAKTHPSAKIVYGGTPTLKGLSSIEWAYLNSDQRKLFVPCPHCGEEHVLDWGNVRWREDPDHNHEVYGHALPETAFYVCPHCGATWDDHQKNEAVRRAVRERRWRATQPFEGVAGYYLSELYVSWDASRMSNLVRRYLQAKHKAAQGDSGELVAFWNSVLGLPYEFGEGQLPREELEALALDYPERTVPNGGLVLTVGVDVQHNRFALVVRAWGRGEESWLVYAAELFGTVTDKTDPVWQELEQTVFGAFQRASGQEARAKAVSIDAGDGVTSDLVYSWVRDMKRRYPGVTIMPVKGSSDRNMEREIFSLPRTVDHRTPTKADRWGLRVFIVGVNKAKDLLLGGDERAGRLRLSGNGPGRFHVYRDVRADYWDHLSAEVKAPSRRHRNRLVWQKKAGRPNEFLDCEIYALHAARALKVHTWTPGQWERLERQTLQSDLFSRCPTQENRPSRDPDPKVTQEKPVAPRKRKRRSWVGLGREDWTL
ncbi:phage terminase large subunit family protein [Thioalkalivibrio sulfidiphilus]|uniref:phage terminase large subunit family protein n=1 Tax=Thioalkalivibrio sulfidiphilus TaxID=1033854 RepID=UPI000369C6F1|nr:terminase gpA endonuclease subunit [Thioalkalivibrio sulfidiphilus]